MMFALPVFAADLQRPTPALAGFRVAVTAALLTLATACSAADETRAVLHTATGDYPFTVEIADDSAEHAKGLMFRDKLAPDAGMLFDYGGEREVSFWMQNTLIPLDMVFIGGDGMVKSIHVNARPLDTTPIPSGAPVQFVLEIPGGRSAEIGLAPGDTLENLRVGKTF
ncbi:MAG: hypothetical protein JWR75_611 [Devosia sp.]|nr:hypothetical protein [Devosia sp.]